MITVFLNHQNCENVRGRTFSFRKHINSPFSSVTKRIPAASTAAPSLTALTADLLSTGLYRLKCGSLPRTFFRCLYCMSRRHTNGACRRWITFSPFSRGVFESSNAPCQCDALRRTACIYSFAGVAFFICGALLATKMVSAPRTAPATCSGVVCR